MSKTHVMTVASASRKTTAKPAAHKGKKIRHMIVTPGANGGAVVEHHFQSPSDMMTPTPPTELHPFKTAKEAGKHVTGMLAPEMEGTEQEGAAE